MYQFYDKILNEVDLQDLAEYLAEPLNRLNVLIDKLNKIIQDNKSGITATELLLESKKIVDKILPELVDNYCNLSLDFRNNIIIKQYINKAGIEKKLTSKDLLLKNTSKIIEHIQLLEEKFYKEYSFDFLVNSRIIAELGFQSSFIEEDKESIVLENKYKYDINDSQKIINEELVKNGKENFLTKLESKKENKNQTNVSLLLKKEEEIPSILEKVNKEEMNSDILIAPKIISDEINNELENNGSISLIEILFVLGFIALTMAAIFVTYGKVIENQKTIQVEKVYNQNENKKIQDPQELIKMEENVRKFKEQLNNENKGNNIENYLKEHSNKNIESPYNIIEKNFNPYSNNKEELIMKEKTLEFIRKLEEQNKKAQ